jgi:hypothetical protein
VEVPREDLESFRRELMERTAWQVRIDEDLRQDS